MITIKQMLIMRENRNSKSVSYGCLMAMFPKSISNKLVEFGKKIIRNEDLYTEGNEFGRETEGHVTVRYGFTKDLNELDIRRLLKGQKPFVVELNGLDIFEGQPNKLTGQVQPYDVVYLKAKSSVLEKLNEETKKFPHVDTFSGYNPHATIAYVQRGKFPHDSKEGFSIPVTITRFCYSPTSGGKSYFDLEEDDN